MVLQVFSGRMARPPRGPHQLLHGAAWHSDAFTNELVGDFPRRKRQVGLESGGFVVAYRTSTGGPLARFPARFGRDKNRISSSDSSAVRPTRLGVCADQVHKEMTECHQPGDRLRFGVCWWRLRYWPCCLFGVPAQATPGPIGATPRTGPNTDLVMTGTGPGQGVTGAIGPVGGDFDPTEGYPTTIPEASSARRGIRRHHHGTVGEYGRDAQHVLHRHPNIDLPRDRLRERNLGPVERAERRLHRPHPGGVLPEHR